ncbi:MAG TPA: transketolase C-terminal domain-containing protein [Nocardioidaceae bacterium]|nr:transketolase C-terminal domain-containing protein [Nocardioidaceae bacterium]
MPRTTFSQAIELALSAAMAEDDRVLVLGEDVQMLRRSLFLRFGTQRVRNTPISESAMLGTALGAAMAGWRPVAEIMFVDFVTVAMDMLMNHAAKLATFSNGRWRAPLVVRAACGGGYGDAGQHEQALWGMLAGVPGLSVVVPSTPADAAGLMLAALHDPGPVVFLEHKLLSQDWLEAVGGHSRARAALDVPENGTIGEVSFPPEATPLGQAALRRPGTNLALVSVGVGVHRCLSAAATLADEGIDTAVLDLRTVSPLDREAVTELASSTGHVLVVDEDYTRGGLSGEIAAVIAERDTGARFGRVTCEGTIPYARELEREMLPNEQRIVTAAHRLLGRESRQAASSQRAR